MTPQTPQRLLVFSCWVVSNSLQPHGLQHTRPPCPSLSPGICCHIRQADDAILPLLPLLPSSSPAFNLSQHQGIFQWVGSLHQVAKVLPINIQGWFPLGLPWCSGWFDLLVVQRCVLVAQSCPALCNSKGCSLSGSSVHKIFQAIIPEWVSFSRGSSQLRDQTHVSCVSCIAGRFFTHWAIGKACSEIPRF